MYSAKMIPSRAKPPRQSEGARRTHDQDVVSISPTRQKRSPAYDNGAMNAYADNIHASPGDRHLLGLKSTMPTCSVDLSEPRSEIRVKNRVVPDTVQQQKSEKVAVE